MLFPLDVVASSMASVVGVEFVWENSAVFCVVLFTLRFSGT
jgi:hypothetical protein